MAPLRVRSRRLTYRFYIPLISRLFPNFIITLPRMSLATMMRTLTSRALYMLGPVLIVATCGIVYSLSYTFWNIVIPLRYHTYSSAAAIIHQTIVIVLVANIIFNYFACVMTRNFPGAHYEKVVRQLALATGFEYPDNEEEVEMWRSSWRELVNGRLRRTRLNDRAKLNRKYGLDEESGMSPEECLKHDDGSTEDMHDIMRKAGIQPRGPGKTWMWIGPQDWTYHDRTRMPKPPRAHFDSVTQTLVLNMDHYCPWMFNTIGYFNYRYFVNFVMFVSIGMIYGAFITYHPFMLLDSVDYHMQITQSRKLFLDAAEEDQFHRKATFRYSEVQHLIPGVPTPHESMPLAFCFMICVAVGLSVTILFSFHLYLICTAQTTIEFHGNNMKKARCEEVGETYSNTYDLGVKRNFEQVWGRFNSWHKFWIVLLPSLREPEFLPVPIKGIDGRREKWKIGESEDNEESVELLQV
mmetsp:Transcript_15603/g.23381  ORF Transcript_15603/g.23381 Transcript_15603/m.23381 type:complete len:466 (-) Transcript_15603:62-1459(-)